MWSSSLLYAMYLSMVPAGDRACKVGTILFRNWVARSDVKWELVRARKQNLFNVLVIDNSPTLHRGHTVGSLTSTT